jgi:hypothetical protein
VRAVSDQRQRIRRQTKSDLGNDEAKVERRAYGEGASEIGRLAAVSVSAQVMGMVVRDEGAPPVAAFRPAVDVHAMSAGAVAAMVVAPDLLSLLAHFLLLAGLICASP